MRWACCAMLVAVTAMVSAGCSHEDKQWMKVNQTYTTAEFRRDIAACTKDGDLDEPCMRARGWVDVTPSKQEKPKPPENLRVPPTPGTPPTR